MGLEYTTTDGVIFFISLTPQLLNPLTSWWRISSSEFLRLYEIKFIIKNLFFLIKNKMYSFCHSFIQFHLQSFSKLSKFSKFKWMISWIYFNIWDHLKVQGFKSILYYAVIRRKQNIDVLQTKDVSNLLNLVRKTN